MRWLLFLSRLAFISGVCIIIWLVMAYTGSELNEQFSHTVILIGYLMGLLFLPVTNLLYLAMTIAGKKLRPVIPRWLIWMNLFFLILLLYYIFYLNDPYYHQG